MLQVAVTDLSPAGPIQAVEIQVESSSLANMCRVHHAIVRRIQVPQPAGLRALGGGSEGSVLSAPCHSGSEMSASICLFLVIACHVWV